VLPNGLTYYVRKNIKPEHRAELRLVVNTGSIMETDNQQGLAHFCEHMAFNGTTNFRKSELVDFLERTGMRFGADLNAYTSFDETVYMLQIPTDTEKIFLKAMQILVDWTQNVSL
jgi:zinc protease